MSRRVCRGLLLGALALLAGSLAWAAPTSASGAEAEWVTLLAQKGLLWSLAVAFGTGVLVSFTPCVYPMIPITIGIIGGRDEQGGVRRSLFLSCIYVLGLAIVYSALGVAVGLAGSAVRNVLMSPYVLLGVAMVFGLLGLSMLGLFDLQIPPALATRLQSLGGKGFFGVLLLGMVSGLVASPCVAAPLAGLLTYVAVTGNAVLGFLLLFAFSWGMGLLLIVAGTSAGALKALPRSGEWMVDVKRLLGFVLLGAAVYFIRTLIPELAYLLTEAVLLVVAGITLGALDSLPVSPGAILRAKRGLGVALVVLGFYVLLGTLQSRGLLLAPAPSAPSAPMTATGEPPAPAGSVPPAVSAPPGPGLAWQSDIRQAFALAKREKKPVLLDFRADWCEACVEMEERVYPEPEVVRALKGYVLLRVDMTEVSKEEDALQTKYGIVGYPTVVVAHPDGSLSGSLVGYQNARDLVDFLKSGGASAASASPAGPTSPKPAGER